MLQVFSINTKKRSFRSIAGCRVRNGAVRKASSVKVLRKGQVVFEGKPGRAAPLPIPLFFFSTHPLFFPHTHARARAHALSHLPRSLVF